MVQTDKDPWYIMENRSKSGLVNGKNRFLFQINKGKGLKNV